MNKNDVDIFEKLSGQVLSIYEEISLLSKKNPNDALNKFKLKLVNKILNESNNFLGKKYRPFEDFSVFNEDDIPQNSDVVFILSQYLQCFEELSADNVVVHIGQWHWKVTAEKGEKGADNGMIYIRTVRPKNLKE